MFNGILARVRARLEWYVAWALAMALNARGLPGRLSSGVGESCGMTKPIDFELPCETEEMFRFDEAFRERRRALLFWYRGYW